MNVRSPVLTPTLVALAVAGLLAALSLVTWRQARALEVLSQLDTVRQERMLADVDRDDLERRIQFLESRQRVVTDAAERLGMHRPDATEMVLLSGAAP